MMTSCPDEQRCLEVLEEILDNESTEEKQQMYYKHLDGCWTCFKNYNLEKSIRQLIKTKIENKPVPDGLLEKIQAEIDKPSAS